MTRLSLRARLTVFHTAVLIGALCAFGADLWWMEGRLGLRRVDRELDGLSDTVALQMAHELREGETLADAARETVQSLSIAARGVAVIDGHERSLAASGGIAAWAGPWPARSAVVRRSAETPAGAWRLRVDQHDFLGQPAWILVASSLRDVQRQQHEVLETIWLAVPIALLLAGGGGFWMATRTIRPIEDALRAQRQFMADASHELRTPVSVVRTASEIGLALPHRHEREYRETLTIVSGQAQRLTRLVESMLVLARADAAGYPIRRADVYLDEIVSDCCRAVTVLCEERNVTIRRGPWPEQPFRGDEDLLRQMTTNLLTNAIQHSRAGSVVSVNMTHDSNGIRISIADNGPGIPIPDQQRIFERFVRLDAARTGTGAGLGLPIARWIAEAHGGSVTLEQTGPEGSTFRITLPLPRPARA